MTIDALTTDPNEPLTCELLPCVLYMRLSDARKENGSFEDRETKLRRRARQLGWRVVRVVIENDVINGDGGARSKSASAYKRRRVKNPDGTYARLPDGRYEMRVWRPGFQSVLSNLTHRRARAVLAEDLDRTLRDPRDAQDFIDVMADCKGWAESMSGSLKFTAGGTDTERMMCEMLVSHARMSSADTARRVSDARERQALNGRYGGGKRPYGFLADGVTVDPGEAAEIVKWADAVLAGIPLRSVAHDLRERAIPTVTGLRWTSPTVRDILLRPRNAAIMVHKGRELLDVATPWEPILPEDVWRAVVAKLKDPAAMVTWTTEQGKQRTAVRGTNVGRAPRWLGSQLFVCHCGAPVAVQVSKTKAPAYRCDVRGEGHIVRNVAKVDALVVRWVVARLSRVDAADMFDAPVSGELDLNALRAEVAVLRQRKADLAASFADGEIDRAQLASGTKRVDAKLRTAQDSLASVTDRSPLTPMVGADNPQETWDGLSLGERRAIIKDLMTVTILPTTARRYGFDEGSVRIDPMRRTA